MEFWASSWSSSEISFGTGLAIRFQVTLLSTSHLKMGHRRRSSVRPVLVPTRTVPYNMTTRRMQRSHIWPWTHFHSENKFIWIAWRKNGAENSKKNALNLDKSTHGNLLIEFTCILFFRWLLGRPQNEFPSIILGFLHERKLLWFIWRLTSTY